MRRGRWPRGKGWRGWWSRRSVRLIQVQQFLWINAKIIGVGANQPAQKWLRRQILKIALFQRLDDVRPNSRVQFDLKERQPAGLTFLVQAFP